jgi:hypothetical protein
MLTMGRNGAARVRKTLRGAAPAVAGLLVGAAACVSCAPREPTGGAPGSASATASSAPSAAPETSAAPVLDQSPDARFERALRASSPELASFMDQAADLRLEILVTEVHDDGSAWPTYAYRADAEYFYPASAIKPFLATAALRWTSSKAKHPIEPTSRILRCAHHRPRCEPPPADEDKDAEKEEAALASDSTPGEDAPDEPKKKRKKLMIGQEIQKLLGYSDNDSYDRLFDIVGHRELNETMRAIGFPDVRFQHRTDGPADMQRTTLAYSLVRPNGQAIVMKERTSDLTFPPLAIDGLRIGTSYRGDRGPVDGPMDFSTKNRASLHDLQRLLVSLLYPKRAGSADLGLTDAQRAMIVSAMTRRPEPGATVADHDPMSPGVLDHVDPKSLDYIGKAGKAYGFLLENAFIRDKDTRRAVFVAATVFANPDGVMNDDVYGYEETARPALRAIGAAVAQNFLGKDATP